MAHPTFPMIAKTTFGLEEVLARELLLLGATDVLKINRAVSFTGDQSLLYRANYCCRTALRILKPLFHFEILKQGDLYDRLYAYRWEDLIDPEQTLSIDAVISYTVFTNSQYVAQKSKDAIVDRLRDKLGKRPSVDLDNADMRINVHLFKDLCTVSLDSSGPSLHRRGYRKSTGPAPINEVLAAGLVLLSGWDVTTPLFDPMCGSGTLLIEAAMIAKNLPAGHFRDFYSFMKWNDFDSGLWERIRAEALHRVSTIPLTLFGNDRSGSALEAAAHNLRYTGFQRDIALTEVSFEESAPPAKTGFIICNPPYDERIKLDDAVAFYKMIGNTLKRKYSGYQAWFISSDIESLKFIGLRPSRKIVVFNGPLECRFVKFEVFPEKKTGDKNLTG